MTGVPIIVGPDGTQVLERVALTPDGKSSFDEAWLQRLVHENPACLPISEIEPGLGRFTAICREMPVPGRGFLDNLLMTGAGDLAFVETKLFRNPEARRQVVAQTLDYATSLFALGYDAFQRAALGGIFGPNSKPGSLFMALPEADRLAEEAFTDAVSANLRRGRALILVVGDGIRSEAEALLGGLHVHARLGFTLALVELAVFLMPGEQGHYLVRPRTLAKTEIIQRTIVEVVNGNATVKEERLASPETLSSEAYWRALDAKLPGSRAALEKLITAADPLGVYPEFLGSLNFKWQRPNGKPVNLGYIFKHASIWTDAAAWSTPLHLARAYVEDLAAAFDCQVNTTASGKAWTLHSQGKPLRLAAVVNRLNNWLGPMERFITAIQHHDSHLDEAG